MDRYPLYSGADQALFLLGQSYEAEIEVIRKNGRMNEVVKGKMIDELTKEAAASYDKIITRYPAMDRALDAKARLEAMHQPVPRPTRAALELNKKEIASRHEEGIMSSMLGNFEKHPDVALASHVGEPTMVDPEPTNPTTVIRNLTAAAGLGGDNKLGAETINGKVCAEPTGTALGCSTCSGGSICGTASRTALRARIRQRVGDELKPNVADPNELKPNVEAADPNPLPALQQNNEIDSGTSSASSSSSTEKPEEMADISSSKKKKKKGINKLNPF